MNKGGKREGAGRKKGSISKINKDIREAIKESFDELGGVSYLVKMGKEQPASYMALLSKILPKEVNINHREATLEKLCEKLGNHDLDALANAIRAAGVSGDGGTGEGKAPTIQ